MLINDILDLSKIEAGKVDLQCEPIKISTFTNDMKMLFSELAIEKQINFKIQLEVNENEQVITDRGRAEQIIKNLLSNAFKFTPAGGQVEMKIANASSEIIFKEKSLLQAEKVIAFAVHDTGIGIAEDKQKLVFEAFQQADGSTSRKYGGTGLGLAICKELAHMMGGEITLESVEGAGSTFVFYLPYEPSVQNQSTEISAEDEKVIAPVYHKPDVEKSYYQEDEIRDDRTNIKKGDKVILIVEDDYVFARMLMNQCHKYNFKAIIALQGDQGLHYAKQYTPYAIILDMRLPVMDGWTILKKLK
jgi:CheY-like chemotaxis protein